MLADNPGAKAFLEQTKITNKLQCLNSPAKWRHPVHYRSSEAKKREVQKAQLLLTGHLPFFLVADTALDPKDLAFTNQAI